MILKKKFDNLDNKVSPYMFGTFQNVAISLLMSVGVCVILYRNKMIEFKNTQLIKKKNDELKTLNNELINLNQELKKLSTVDFLTNISNRRKFEEVLKVEWSRAVRDASKISVIIFDIDFFKQYNDYYGHAEGDLCLQKIGKILNNCIKRKFECVARFGGEEFACILPNTDINEAYAMCEMIRKSIHEENIIHEKSAVADIITASFGIACISPAIGDFFDKLIKSADDALYSAKKNGRNRIECADDIMLL